MERKRNPGIAARIRRPRISLRCIRTTMTGFSPDLPLIPRNPRQHAFMTTSTMSSRLGPGWLSHHFAKACSPSLRNSPAASYCQVRPAGRLPISGAVEIAAVSSPLHVARQFEGDRIALRYDQEDFRCVRLPLDECRKRRRPLTETCVHRWRTIVRWHVPSPANRRGSNKAGSRTAPPSMRSDHRAPAWLCRHPLRSRSWMRPRSPGGHAPIMALGSLRDRISTHAAAVRCLSARNADRLGYPYGTRPAFEPNRAVSRSPLRGNVLEF